MKMVVCEQKFRHGFRDTLNLLCPCSIEAEPQQTIFRVTVSVA